MCSFSLLFNREFVFEVSSGGDIICTEPTGVLQLVVYPLGPSAVVLSWQRPYHVTFRKYVLQTFFFNPVTLTSEWSTYYEIAATASVIASVVTHRRTQRHTHTQT